MAATVIKLDEKTWRIEDIFVYSYLLIGDQKALLIDTGMNGADTVQAARKLTDLPMILANTHGDGDHTGGTGEFSEYYMHHADYQNMGLAEKFPNAKQIDIKEGDEFDLGSRLVKVIEIPGHTYGSVAFLDQSTKTLIVGDTVQTSEIFMMGAHRCPPQLKGSLEKLAALKNSFDTIYAAHGKAVLPSDHVDGVLEDWNAVMSGAIESVNEEVHGMPIRTFHGKYCGFYCERT